MAKYSVNTIQNPKFIEYHKDDYKDELINTLSASINLGQRFAPKGDGIINKKLDLNNIVALDNNKNYLYKLTCTNDEYILYYKELQIANNDSSNNLKENFIFNESSSIKLTDAYSNIYLDLTDKTSGEFNYTDVNANIIKRNNTLLFYFYFNNDVNNTISAVYKSNEVIINVQDSKTKEYLTNIVNLLIAEYNEQNFNNTGAIEQQILISIYEGINNHLSSLDELQGKHVDNDIYFTSDVDINYFCNEYDNTLVYCSSSDTLVYGFNSLNNIAVYELIDKFNKFVLYSSARTADNDINRRNLSALKFESEFDINNNDIVNIISTVYYSFPYIYQGNWWINDRDTTIRANGLDAGNPNIIFVEYDYTNETNEKLKLISDFSNTAIKYYVSDISNWTFIPNLRYYSIDDKVINIPLLDLNNVGSDNSEIIEQLQYSTIFLRIIYKETKESIADIFTAIEVYDYEYDENGIEQSCFKLLCKDNNDNVALINGEPSGTRYICDLSDFIGLERKMTKLLEAYPYKKPEDYINEKLILDACNYRNKNNKDYLHNSYAYLCMDVCNNNYYGVDNQNNLNLSFRFSSHLDITHSSPSPTWPYINQETIEFLDGTTNNNKWYDVWASSYNVVPSAENKTTFIFNDNVPTLHLDDVFTYNQNVLNTINFYNLRAGNKPYYSYIGVSPLDSNENYIANNTYTSRNKFVIGTHEFSYSLSSKTLTNYNQIPVEKQTYLDFNFENVESNGITYLNKRSYIVDSIITYIEDGDSLSYSYTQRVNGNSFFDDKRIKIGQYNTNSYLNYTYTYTNRSNTYATYSYLNSNIFDYKLYSEIDNESSYIQTYVLNNNDKVRTNNYRIKSYTDNSHVVNKLVESYNFSTYTYYGLDSDASITSFDNHISYSKVSSSYNTGAYVNFENSFITSDRPYREVIKFSDFRHLSFSYNCFLTADSHLVNRWHHAFAGAQTGHTSGLAPEYPTIYTYQLNWRRIIDYCLTDQEISFNPNCTVKVNDCDSNYISVAYTKNSIFVDNIVRNGAISLDFDVAIKDNTVYYINITNNMHGCNSNIFNKSYWLKMFEWDESFDNGFEGGEPIDPEPGTNNSLSLDVVPKIVNTGDDNETSSDIIFTAIITDKDGAVDYNNLIWNVETGDNLTNLTPITVPEDSFKYSENKLTYSKFTNIATNTRYVQVSANYTFIDETTQSVTKYSTIYPKGVKKYKVEFNTNGGTAVAEREVEENTTIELPLPTHNNAYVEFKSSTGVTNPKTQTHNFKVEFDYWKYGNTTYKDGDEIIVKSNMELKAYWKVSDTEIETFIFEQPILDSNYENGIWNPQFDIDNANSIKPNVVDGAIINKTFTYTATLKQVKYYYYAGWTKPSESNLEELAKSVNEITGHQHGGEVDTSKTYSRDNVLYNYTTNATMLENDSKLQYYVVIPNSINGHTFNIYDAMYNKDNSFIEQASIEITNHKVFLSAKAWSQIKANILF